MSLSVGYRGGRDLHARPGGTGVCGGRLAGLRSIRLSAVWLLWLAAVVQAAQYYVAPLRHPAMLVIVFGLVLWWLPAVRRGGGWLGVG